MMIEADKMLHLRKYVLTVLRCDTKLHVARSLYSTSPSVRKAGYVRHSLHHCRVPQTNLRPNYTACGIRTFSTTIAQSSADEVNQKVTSFCNDVKHDQTCPVDRLKEVIWLCDENNYQLQPDTSVLLLKCCGSPLSTVTPNERQNLANQVWRLVKENGGALTLEHYNTLLNVHVENSSSVDPEKFLADMNVQPDDDTYRLLFNNVAKTGNTKHLQSIMSMILRKTISLDQDVLCTLVQTLLTNGNTTAALNVITSMQNANLPINKMYTELACEYATQGDISNVMKILKDEPQSNVSLFRIIKSLSLSGNGGHIPAVANFLTGPLPTIESEIKNLIEELVRADRAMDAHAIINCVVSNKEAAQHTTSFINNFLNKLIMMNVPAKDITKSASNFVQSGCEPEVLTNIAETSLKLGREKLSLAIFTAIRENGIEIRPHYYWPLLLDAQRNEGEAKIYSLIASMRAMDIDIDVDTVTGYVLPFVNTVNPLHTMERLKMNGVPESVLNTSMIYFLLKKHRLEDVLFVCQDTDLKLNYKILMTPLMHVYFATRDIERCAKVLTVSKKGSDFVGLFLMKLLKNKYPILHIQELQDLLKTFDKHNVKFSQHDSNFLKNKIDIFDVDLETKMNLYKIIDKMVEKKLRFSTMITMPHPRYMSPSELACHFIWMNSKGGDTKYILKYLLEAYYLDNNLKKAEKIKQEYDMKQYPWTTEMKIQLFILYVEHGKLKEAETLLAETLLADIKMTDQFPKDRNMILLFATALVKVDKPKIAFHIIENFFNVNNRKNMFKNCVKLLTALAESKYHNNTKDMLYFLTEKKYCKITNDVLRPLVAIPLKQKDIPSAIAILTKCLHMYKKIPMAVEVFTELLREKDNENVQRASKLIEEMYDMIANIHGIQEANTYMIMGLANLNKMEELRNILQEQKISMSVIIRQFTYMQKLDDTKCLLRILEASQDTSNVDQVFLCDMLLSFYSKIGDQKSIFTLLELIRAKNINPGKSFKIGFTEFCQLNKIPLPAEFESEINKINVNIQ
ncbi:leucine-rich PPR motif-containing protein, mitochondrial-like [Odontomachus brunneus]|uniref:leucine-rich PPR motif-containing protein, mitochondrial-like n=1 Tax=Odontomachus brunneus TaxID=486640 RepID=UPI0013F1E913|nr:leucine-rich PPR motif-containing protein, mitochondrial-like [Odontomachus brunneus]